MDQRVGKQISARRALRILEGDSLSDSIETDRTSSPSGRRNFITCEDDNSENFELSNTESDVMVDGIIELSENNNP